MVWELPGRDVAGFRFAHAARSTSEDDGGHGGARNRSEHHGLKLVLLTPKRNEMGVSFFRVLREDVSV